MYSGYRFDLEIHLSSSLQSLAVFESVFWWEDEEQRARAIERAMGFAANSIMMGHRWAYVTRDFLDCWKKAWGTLAKNGQRRTITSMISSGDDDCQEI